MVQRPKIRHFLAMVMDNESLEAQGPGSFMGLPRLFFPKKYTFYKQWAWQATKAATPLIFRNINVHNQTFQIIYCELLYLY